MSTFWAVSEKFVVPATEQTVVEHGVNVTVWPVVLISSVTVAVTFRPLSPASANVPVAYSA